MKLSKQFIAAFLMLVSGVTAATPEEESRFLNAVRDAYTKKETSAVIALACWDNAPASLKESAYRTIVIYGFSKPVKSVEYVPLDPSAKHGYTKDGVNYGPNLQITKHILIDYVVDSGSQHSNLFAGEKDGKLMLVNLVPQP